MRITGGKLNGKKLILPKKDIRASMDKMRERVFSILKNIIGNYSGYIFLDLFTGSSIIAVEAYSRGFDSAIGIEKDFGKKEIIEKNISFCENKVKVIFSPVERFIKFGKGDYKVIFLDPPFSYKFREDLIIKISNSRFAKSNDILIIHYPKEDELKEEIKGKKFGYLLIKKISFGRSIVSFYKKQDYSEVWHA